MDVRFKYFDPDLGLPSLESLGGGESSRGGYTGTKGLMLAVLEDGIRSYLSPVRRISAEAELWVGDGRSRSPFSFVVICEALGLDPVAARDALKRLRLRAIPGVTQLPRNRPNVRRPGRVRMAARR